MKAALAGLRRRPADRQRQAARFGLSGSEGARTKLIANFGVGFSHIDIDAARQRGIVVTNTPGVLTDCTADLAISLMLCGCPACRRRRTAASRRRVEGLVPDAHDRHEGFRKDAWHHRHGPHRQGGGQARAFRLRHEDRLLQPLARRRRRSRGRWARSSCRPVEDVLGAIRLRVAALSGRRREPAPDRRAAHFAS